MKEINIGDHVFVEQKTEAVRWGDHRLPEEVCGFTTFRFNGIVLSRQGEVLVLECVENKNKGTTFRSNASIHDVVKVESK